MKSILPSPTIRTIIMLISSLSDDEADILYKMPKSIIRIRGTNRWIPRSTKDPISFYLEIDVITEDETELIVRAWRGLKGKKRYSFALLNKDKTPIRRWDDKVGDEHPVTKELTKGPHKHFWSEEHQDRAWYSTADVRSNDHDGAVLDFLKECNIETHGFHIQQDIGSVSV